MSVMAVAIAAGVEDATTVEAGVTAVDAVVAPDDVGTEPLGSTLTVL